MYGEGETGGAQILGESASSGIPTHYLLTAIFFLVLVAAIFFIFRKRLSK